MRFFSIILILLIVCCKTPDIQDNIIKPNNSNLGTQALRLKSVTITLQKDSNYFPPQPGKQSQNITTVFNFKYINGNLTQVIEENSDELFKTFLIKEANYIYNSQNQLIEKKYAVINNFDIPYGTENSNLSWKDSSLLKIDDYTIKNKNTTIELTYPCSKSDNYLTKLSFNENKYVKEISTNGAGCVPSFDSFTIKTELIQNTFESNNLTEQIKSTVMSYNSGSSTPKLENMTISTQEKYTYNEFKNPFSLLPNNAFPLKYWYLDYNNFNALETSFLDLYYLNGRWSQAGAALQAKYLLSNKQYSQKEYIRNYNNFSESYLYNFNIVEAKDNFPIKAEEKVLYKGKPYCTLKYSFEFESN